MTGDLPASSGPDVYMVPATNGAPCLVAPFQFDHRATTPGVRLALRTTTYAARATLPAIALGDSVIDWPGVEPGTAVFAVVAEHDRCNQNRGGLVHTVGC